MQWRTLAGIVAVVVVVLGGIGIVSNFFLENDLLFASEMQTGAVVSLGFVLLALAVFALVGRPWTRWSRTPYW